MKGDRKIFVGNRSKGRELRYGCATIAAIPFGHALAPAEAYAAGKDALYGG
jgi:hypothetical protein